MAPRGKEGLIPMKNIITVTKTGVLKPPQVYVSDTGTSLGRGVFAEKGFYRDEVVEIAPVVLMNVLIRDKPTTLQRLVFSWSYLAKSDVHHAIALGYGSLYNHSDTPNLRYEADPDSNTIRFVALRIIDPGEQLTIDYDQIGEDEKPQNKNWFQTNQVEKVEIEG